MGESIITSRILESADAIGTKAQEYICEREPEFWNWLMKKATDGSKEVLVAAKNHRQPRDEIIRVIISTAMQAVMAEVLARDTMDGKENRKLNSLIKAGYEDVSKAMERAAGAHQDEGVPTPEESSFDQAIKQETEKE